MKCNPIFSPEDGDLYKYSWHCHKTHSRAHRKNIRAHRIVLSRMLGRPLTKEDICDHINGNGLDNRRENLRLSDHAKNSQNLALIGTSGHFRGVVWNKSTKKFQSQVRHKGYLHYCGSYTLAIDAAKAAHAKRVELGFIQDRCVKSMLEII